MCSEFTVHALQISEQDGGASSAAPSSSLTHRGRIFPVIIVPLKVHRFMQLHPVLFINAHIGYVFVLQYSSNRFIDIFMLYTAAQTLYGLILLFYGNVQFYYHFYVNVK
jgi:hypothetical protein